MLRRYEASLRTKPTNVKALSLHQAIFEARGSKNTMKSTSKKCPVCGKTAYPLESYTANEQLYHK